MFFKRTHAITALIVFVLCLNFTASARAEFFAANWLNATGRYTFRNDVFLFGEMQARSTRDPYHFNMFVANGGAGYRVAPRHTFTVFAGQFMTFANDEFFGEPLRTNETRLSEQWVGTHQLWALSWEHRIRTEQRWVNGRYRNRFRYRLQNLIPIDKRATWNIVLFDEVFFSDSAPEFARNRSYAGVRHALSKTFTIQPGLLYEYDRRLDQSDLHTVYLQVNLMFDLKQSKSEN